MKKTDTMTYKRYPAKILLFGEYLLLRGATALSLPVHQFGGHWAWAGKHGKPPMQGRLPEFAKSDVLRAIPEMDCEAFASELSRGLWLRSNVPGGYGLGSSGVVCAAVLERYLQEKPDDINLLKEYFSLIEGFFHEKSSGIDPLTSYLDQPVVVKNKTEAKIIEWPKWENHLQIFLLDSRQTRTSGKVMHQFLDKTKDPKFATLLDNYIETVHEPMAEAFLEGDFDKFWHHIGDVSAFQWQHQQFLIPESLDHRWSEGLRTDDYFLKICGAGGGGFSLLFVKKPEVAEFLGRLHRLTPLKEII